MPSDGSCFLFSCLRVGGLETRGEISSPKDLHTVDG